MPAKKTTEEFVRDAILVHGDKYDYSKVDYKKPNEKVIIICKIHGEFLQSPNGHNNGLGCQKCARILVGNKNKKDSLSFIKKAKIVHGDKYDYSKVEYINAKIKVIIICKIHGDFLQKPSVHNNGKGCSKCSGNYTYTSEEWIEKAKIIHSNKYIYDKLNYKNNR